MYNANLKENLISVGTFKLKLYVRMYLPIFEQMNTNSSFILCYVLPYRGDRVWLAVRAGWQTVNKIVESCSNLVIF